jgi:GNAT superfamily N-acetyltransferase
VDLAFAEMPPGDARLGAEIYPLLQVLRPELSRAAFDELVTGGLRQGLTVLAALGEHGACVGVALYRVLVTTRARILFVDDLVTSPDARSRGVGASLFGELERRGRAAGCQRVELDSGMTNHGAHRFYYRHRMAAIALHFAKDLHAENLGQT